MESCKKQSSFAKVSAETQIYGMGWNWAKYFLFLKEEINPARMLPFSTYWQAKMIAAIHI